MSSAAERRNDEAQGDYHDPARVRFEGLRAAATFGSVLRAGALTVSYAALIPHAYQLSQQLELELPAYAERAAIRQALGLKIRDEVLPIYSPRWLERVPSRLMLARRTGCFGVPLSTGKPIVYWDLKAGLSRLCPDDAREEAMRLRRRVQPKLEELQASGHQLTYAVFTMPNFAPGKLRNGMEAIYRRFKALLKARNSFGEPMFPEIKGALCVLEAPLGRARDWNVHLNVILVTRGFLNWGTLQNRWHWNVDLRKLSSAPGAIGGALTELIKYAVAATVAKSQKKAEDYSRARAASATEASAVAAPTQEPGAKVRSAGLASNRAQGEPLPYAPPMLEWSARELAEWLEAFHGFRRTRSYGELYGLQDPDPEDLGPIAWLGTVRLVGGVYVHRLHLLDSIPGDKSAPFDALRAWEMYRRRFRPPDITGLEGPIEIPELSA